MTAKGQVGQGQERTILIVLAEVVGRHAWDVIAEHPGALSPDRTGTVERVEIGRRTVVSSWDERAASTSTAVAGVELDTRQVRLEGDAIVIQITDREWAAELDRRGMQSGVAIGPDWLIGDSVKTRIGIQAC